MTENVSRKNMEQFENPDHVPLEKLKLKIRTNGVVENINALDKRWADEHYFLNYEAPKLYNEDGSEIMGAKKHWIEIVKYMIDDLKWLLSLPHYRFWSNIVYNTSIINSLVSFLQEAPPFYALESFPNYPEMLKLLETLRRYVLVVFSRFVTNKESTGEYISREFLGNLLYENYIFTIPIIFDLCQLYGRENGKVMEKILNCLFTLEPRYNNDLQKAVPCLIEALENVEIKFTGCYVCNTNKAVSLPKQGTSSTELTLFNLEDMILYVLDISSTIAVFLTNYPPAVSTFHREDFMNKIVSIYESTIPEMYKKLDKLGNNDANIPKYMELKHRLDVIRVEILHLFRTILYGPIQNVQENLNTMTEAGIKERVEEYLTFLTSVISEKEFITDYDQFYPVATDLGILSSICPEVDAIKCSYIFNSICAIVENPNAPFTAYANNLAESVAGPSGIQNQLVAPKDNISLSNEKEIMKDPVILDSLISEVKDILFHLNEHFIQLCLDHYKYDTASVINAVLEDTLPPHLKELKDLKPAINDTPPDYTEASINEDLALNIGELNMLSDDDDDINNIKPHEIVEVPKDYIVKNYSLVIDDYEDEYDDAYDSRDVRGVARDDSVDIDSRPFTTPRVLLAMQKTETVDESESEDEDVGAEQNGKDHFIQNPAEQRRQQAHRGGRTSNVVGKPRGQGQEKDILYNRQQKNTHKSTRANHNRRSGAQYKRNQGMVPS
ncbi:activating signal cointegrator 1 complex subunit 2 isoform X1 [Colletes gigas]|uniref:activating signal cointegrator 1 complex subunit 2 isoform X1 n=1 Tax=Colletes gigas TaxID=935657 RepID=UPI001C9BB8AE|nr:activating signal cointegrator 1 complex subunit 2 isoform X1 [Colletes gigas]